LSSSNGILESDGVLTSFFFLVIITIHRCPSIILLGKEESEMTEKEFRFKRKIMTDGRKVGILLLLIGIGLPLILSFFQNDGEFRFYNASLIAERNLAPAEVASIKKAIAEEKKRMDTFQRVSEEVKSAARKQLGEDYFKDKWIIREYSGFSIPFKYVIALGLLFVLIGIGKLILG
jgi:hypothetical protein